MTAKDPLISIIIPCYNEEKRLQPGLSRGIERLALLIKEPFEIVLVDDGSTDRTVDILREIKDKNASGAAIEVIGYAQNQGKGFAVKTGVLNAKGDKIIVMDADFSIDLDETNKALDFLDRFDVVVGTKKHSQAQNLKRQRMPRRIMGKGFTLLTNALLGLKFTDITCGFKGFKSAAAKDIFGRQLMKGWAYDAETLFLAERLKYRSIEIPVKWFHAEGSKVSPLSDAMRSMRDLVTILSNHCSGKYAKRS